MMRAVFTWALFASVQASRIQERSVSERKTQTKFGATCEDLQNIFHNRVSSIQSSLDGVDEHSELSAGARARLTIRMHGIMRTLRRARECSWVVDNNSDDFDDMRGIVQTLIAGNPCAEAARSELEQGSDEHPQSIPRAVGILLSDNCEVPPQTASAEETVTEDYQEIEDQVQDRLDDAAADGDENALLEMDKTQRSQFLRTFLRGVAVFLMMVFLLLACVSAAAFIGAFLGIALAVFAEAVLGVDLRYPLAALNWGLYGGAVVGIAGVPTCLYELYNHIVPRLQ
jgi:hypothetical protein